MAGWIGVDLDGTLAHFDRWRGPRHIGLPIPAMAKRVHDWHARGVEVRIFTARASRPELIPDVQKWLDRHGFPPFAITNQKDFGMVELWDDRAIQVLYNTGKAVRPNHLQDVEKAELFDPDQDTVYSDDERNVEMTPTEDEVEQFKRNIQASTEDSSYSLDDLMDALDNGDYAPGVAADVLTAADDPDKTQLQAPEQSAPDVASISQKEPPPAAISEAYTGDETISFEALPLTADEFARPKGTLVEIDIGETEQEPAITDDSTAEFPVIEDQDIFATGPLSSPPALDETAHTIEKQQIETEEELASMDASLDNQPVRTLALDSLEGDSDLDIAIGLEDIQEDSRDTTMIPPPKPSNHIPRFSAFPEDELDDFDDLPALKVDRR